MKTSIAFFCLSLLALVLAATPQSIRAGTPLPVLLDSDRDGVPDPFDSCPDEPNIGLQDRDGDGVVDHCDLDADASGRLVAIQR